MVFFAKDPESGRFVCYQSNAINLNTDTGEVTSLHDPRLGYGSIVDEGDNPGVQMLLNVLNGRVCGDADDISEDDEYEESHSECSSDSGMEEIETDEPEKLTVRKGEKLIVYRKMKESSPRRHAAFPDVVFESIQTQSSSPTITVLNDLCLSYILSHLNVIDLFKVACVCKKMYNLSAARLASMKRLSVLQIWRGLSNLYDSDEKASDEDAICTTFNTPLITQSNLMTLLTATGGNLRELYLDTSVGEDSYSAVYISKEMSTAVSRFCKNLEILVIEFSKIGGSIGLGSFIKHLPAKNKLKSLALKANVRRRDGMVLTETMLGDFLKKTKSLERLHLEGCEAIIGISIVKHLKNNKMKSFTFATCRNLSTSVLEFIRNTYSKSLEQLGFYTSMPHGGFSDLDYHLLSNSQSLEITYESPMLEKMKRFWAMKYDDCMPISFPPEGVNIQLLRLMPNLVELDLSFNCDLDENPLFLRSVAAQCPLIEVLKLCGANTASIKPLVYLENMFYLKVLDLENICTGYAAPRWSMFDFDGFSKTVAPLLKALKRLNFSGTDIGESAIFNIIKNIASLAFLDITSHAGDENRIKGKFIEKCHGLTRSEPITVAMEIDDELSRKEVKKLKATINTGPGFLTINTQYMDMKMKPSGWFNEYFEFEDSDLFI